MFMNKTDFQTLLKEKGLRSTQSRLMIFEVLQKTKRALSTKEVFQKLSLQKDLTTDLVSVYRNLDLLTEIGLAHKFQDGRYKSCDHKHEHKNHSHIHVLFTCTSCSKSEEVSSHSNKLCSLATELKKQSKLLSKTQEIIVQGLCLKCSK